MLIWKTSPQPSMMMISVDLSRILGSLEEWEYILVQIGQICPCGTSRLLQTSLGVYIFDIKFDIKSVSLGRVTYFTYISGNLNFGCY